MAALLGAWLAPVPAGAVLAPRVGLATPVTDWSAYAEQAVTVGRPPGSAEVLLGIVHVAMYDAVVSVDRSAAPFLVRVRGPRDSLASAAVATAAHDVLVSRVPSSQPFVDSTYAAYLAGIADGQPKDDGISVGHEVAAADLIWRAGDGFDNVVPYVQPTPGPGVFEPTAATTPVDVKLAQVRPLALTAADQFRPDGPYPLTSHGYARDFAEVKAFGAKDSSARTNAQTQTALFWSENRVLALAHVASADAVIGCFDAKYHYLFWRPFHAIPRADTDGNPLTSADPAWQPLLNVNHPEYPSAHACWTAALTQTVAGFFHTDRVGFDVDSQVTGTTRHYTSFSQAASEVTNARIWSGLHFRHSMVAGAQLGRHVAQQILTRFAAAAANSGRDTRCPCAPEPGREQ